MTKDCVMELRKYWGVETTDRIIVAAICEGIVPMKFDDFLRHCSPCGGDWGGMFLSGIKELHPAVWEAIPDSMGRNAFTLIVDVLEIIGVEMPKDE